MLVDITLTHRGYEQNTGGHAERPGQRGMLQIDSTLKGPYIFVFSFEYKNK